jgi:AAA+ ATPase superfamily predicted ATPase
MLPVLPRIPGVLKLIENKNYFNIYAPRQSGKTTFIKTLVNKINSDGNYYAFDCSFGVLDGVEDKTEAMDTIVASINKSVKRSKIPHLNALGYPDDEIPQSDPGIKVNNMLNYLSRNLDKDLVVFLMRRIVSQGQL